VLGCIIDLVKKIATAAVADTSLPRTPSPRRTRTSGKALCFPIMPWEANSFYTPPKTAAVDLSSPTNNERL